MRNPLEQAFNMSEDFDIEEEYGVAEQPKQDVSTTEPPVDHKDADDVLIEQRIDEIYTAALDAFKAQQEYLEVIEPRYAARNAEVAANYLNIALSAVNSRSKAKTDRKRANQSFVPYANGGKTTNNVLIADRNEILKMISMDGNVKQLD